MKDLYFLFIILLLIPSVSDAKVYDKEFFEARKNFTYVSDDYRDLWLRYDTIYRPFQGDCEDFAFTLQKQIGGLVWFVIVRQGGHAILVKDGIVYDNLNNHPAPVSRYKLLWVMNYKPIIDVKN